MFKALLFVAVSFMAIGAQAEVVELKVKHVYQSHGEKEISFSTKACGLKAIAFAVEGKHNSYVRYSKAIASYQTDATFGVVRDNFNRFGMIMAGEISPWFNLRADAPCLRKVYLVGEASLWPTSELSIIAYGLK